MLLQADAARLDGSPALYTPVAERLPKSSTGRLFRASFVLAKANRTAVPTGQFEEWDITWVSPVLHPNVCDCLYVRVLGGMPRVFAEYVPGGSLRDRIDEAERRLRGAAEQGEETGMPVLGMVLRDAGRADEAEKWLRAAADKGNSGAMYSLAHLVRQAGREADQWYRRAAEKGSAKAGAHLRRIRAGGRGPSV